MAAHGISDKAGRYLSQLDAARCNGKWDEVPELARKVGKHAPARKCLVLTAQTEVEIVRRSSKRPRTATSSQDPSAQLYTTVQSLQESGEWSEDLYQAQTCLGWMYWNNGDWNGAKSNLPTQLPPTGSEKSEPLAGWTYISMIKSVFIRGSSEEALGSNMDVGRFYESALPTFAELPSFVTGTVEYRRWMERLLTRICLLLHKRSRSKFNLNQASLDVEPLLLPFRAWAKFWDDMPGHGLVPSAEFGVDSKSHKREVWKDYYYLLSRILQSGHPPSPQDNASRLDLTNSRIRQSAELRKVEMTYETLLLKEVSFPQASEVNYEVDEWVDMAMSNWSIICGPTWHDDELGQGGQESVSRNVLDILYRAATRTFHSTSVLRHLFTVHASLAEFDLASRALDSYVEIVSKGKARVEKTGDSEPGLDSDEVMLQTIAAGSMMLCNYGRRHEAAKALELAVHLEDWLSRRFGGADDTPTLSRMNSSIVLTEQISDQALSYAQRAIGASKANWSHFTYEAPERAGLQKEAVGHLRQALILDSTVEDDPGTLFGLALVLAEVREVESAIATVKQALASESKTYTEPVDQASFLQEKKTRLSKEAPLAECWHLLALLLSSRQEFETAEAACQAALEHYEDWQEVSLGQGGESLVKLGFFRRKQIIELRMTQLALAEINEGPDAAVNGAGELVSQYRSLFGYTNVTRPGTAATRAPPKTSSGTIRSLRESVFGRHRESKVELQHRPTTASVRSRRFSNETSRPPTIAVTDDDDTAVVSPSNRLGRHPSHKLQKRPSTKSVRRSRTISPTRSRHGQSGKISPAEKKASAGHTRAEHLSPDSTKSQSQGEVGVAVSPDTGQAPLDSLAQNRSHLGGHSIADSEKPEGSSEARKPPFRIPSPIFPKSEQHRYALCLLVDIWLFIGGLYRRASMFEDAQGAVDEAFKHAKLVEIAAAGAGAGVHTFEQSGWGGVKSVEEVWADAYTEMGNLSLAQGKPHEAMIKYEGALSHFQDHPAASTCLSNLLLDIYAGKLPPLPEKSSNGGKVDDETQHLNESSRPVLSKVALSSLANGNGSTSNGEAFPSFEDENAIESDSINLDATTALDKTPEKLDRLAARDRAYGLLTSLTKLGTAWDNSEAWFALARAYEESGQVEKAKEVLWWVVELEERRPVRNWRCLGQGYSLRS